MKSFAKLPTIYWFMNELHFNGFAIFSIGLESRWLVRNKRTQSNKDKSPWRYDEIQSRLDSRFRKMKKNNNLYDSSSQIVPNSSKSNTSKHHANMDEKFAKFDFKNNSELSSQVIISEIASEADNDFDNQFLDKIEFIDHKNQNQALDPINDQIRVLSKNEDEKFGESLDTDNSDNSFEIENDDSSSFLNAALQLIFSSDKFIKYYKKKNLFVQDGNSAK